MAESKKNTYNSETKFFGLTIYTPQEIFISCNVKSVTIPSILGTFQVLVNHAPILTAISSGVVNIVDEKGETITLFVENGIVEVKNNQVTFSIASVEKIEDIKITDLEQLVNEANLALNQTDLKEATRINMNKKINLMKQKIKAVQNIHQQEQ
ncbi:ATP synthase epsilon chain [bioreactor metagenome]|uniref:ATP synthase epsilon chain n=1 Tax=bioreactor metagenome TaxID=1076179 RepID=A0A644ZN31_9ZZZZ